MEDEIKESIETLWISRVFTHALMSEEQFEKFFKKQEAIEVEPSNILRNNEIVYWDDKFYYDKQLFKECLDIANKLSTNNVKLLMPKKEFPMAFKIIDGENKILYLILAPRDKPLEYVMINK